MGWNGIPLEQWTCGRSIYYIRNTDSYLDIFTIPSRRQSYYPTACADPKNCLLGIDIRLSRRRRVNDSFILYPSLLPRSSRYKCDSLSCQFDTAGYERRGILNYRGGTCNETRLLRTIHDRRLRIHLNIVWSSFDARNCHFSWSLDWVYNNLWGWSGPVYASTF